MCDCFDNGTFYVHLDDWPQSDASMIVRISYVQETTQQSDNLAIVEDDEYNTNYSTQPCQHKTLSASDETAWCVT